MRGYNIDDFIGKKFNHLTLIKNLNKINKNNSKLALFKCDCGNIKEMVFTQVYSEEIKSCGCLVKEKIRKKETRENLLDFYCNSTMKNNKTGCTGISYCNGKYRARIQVNHKSINLGYYNSLDEAVKVRKQAEEKYFKKSKMK